MDYNFTQFTVYDFLLYLRKSRADNEYETVEETLAKHETELQNFAIRLLGAKIPVTFSAKLFPARQSKIARIFKRCFPLSNPALYAVYL